MTFWFRIAFTWWLGHFISCYLTVHFMLIKYTFGSKSQTLRMRYPFQSTGRPISHRNGWSFRVYMIPLRDFVPEWNSRPGARTGVNSRRGDSRRHNILWWCHVNKYRAMRGNRSELAPGRKSPRCHVNTPLVSWLFVAFSVRDLTHIRRRRQERRLFKSVFVFYVGISHLHRSFQCASVLKLAPAEYATNAFTSK